MFFIGRGVPSTVKTVTSRLAPLNPANVPDGITAKGMYEQWFSRALNSESAFGEDPLFQHPGLVAQREQELLRRFTIDDLFGKLTNENVNEFQEAILFFIDTTHQLCP